MSNVSDSSKTPVSAVAGTSGNRRTTMKGVAVLTTAGAVGSTADSDVGVTPAKAGGTGVYTFTFPVSKKLTPISVHLLDASGVTSRVEFVSSVTSTGVVTVQHSTLSADAPAASDGTSGDTIICFAELEYD